MINEYDGKSNSLPPIVGSRWSWLASDNMAANRSTRFLFQTWPI